ncbi:MAG: hypothetical protein GY821_13500 [Gammaproteobacteria bacterium]|nr:hypothetical protein [Gammaproteobacteria bacterium]
MLNQRMSDEFSFDFLQNIEQHKKEESPVLLGNNSQFDDASIYNSVKSHPSLKNNSLVWNYNEHTGQAKLIQFRNSNDKGLEYRVLKDGKIPQLQGGDLRDKRFAEGIV